MNEVQAQQLADILGGEVLRIQLQNNFIWCVMKKRRDQRTVVISDEYVAELVGEEIKFSIPAKVIKLI